MIEIAALDERVPEQKPRADAVRIGTQREVGLCELAQRIVALERFLGVPQVFLRDAHGSAARRCGAAG